VVKGRIPTEFWGPWYFIATLYQRPPLSPGVAVGDALRFGGGAITSGDRYLPGDRLTVESWWTVDAALDADYSISLQVIGPDGRPVAQIDGGPTGAFTPDQTSAWQPGSIYRDDRSLTIPHCLPTGDYPVRLVVYQWWDGVRLAPEPSAWTAPEDSLDLGQIAVDSFLYCAERR